MAKKSKATNNKQAFTSENIKIEFRPYVNKNTVGFATITFYECITVYNCAIVSGKNGYFAAMPQYKGSDGNYYNYVYVDKDDELAAELNTLINESLEAPFD